MALEETIAFTEESVDEENIDNEIMDTREAVEYENTILQNIHDKPDGLIVGRVPAGTVLVLAEDGDWAEIKGGWIQKQYFAI